MICPNCENEFNNDAGVCPNCNSPVGINPANSMPQAVPDMQQTAAEGEKSGMSVASFVLGLIGLIAWCLPIAGFPVTIVGLILGIKGRSKGQQGLATAGIVLCIITLVLTIINSALGAYMGATGQLAF